MCLTCSKLYFIPNITKFRSLVSFARLFNQFSFVPFLTFDVVARLFVFFLSLRLSFFMTYLRSSVSIPVALPSSSSSFLPSHFAITSTLLTLPPSLFRLVPCPPLLYALSCTPLPFLLHHLSRCPSLSLCLSLFLNLVFTNTLPSCPPVIACHSLHHLLCPVLPHSLPQCCPCSLGGWLVVNKGGWVMRGGWVAVCGGQWRMKSGWWVIRNESWAMVAKG